MKYKVFNIIIFLWSHIVLNIVQRIVSYYTFVTYQPSDGTIKTGVENGVIDEESHIMAA